ncbi:MAG TPA: DMT family transporter [Gemmatimonadaceae bacterium]|nr:DMT family transporter [Gemmatimonadaceae bacterium]
MKPSPAGVLGLSLLGISFAGPLTKLSYADPLVVAAWRLLFSLIIVAIALLLTGEWRDWRRLTLRDAGFAAAAGIALALHFWAWNASLHLTTIAASVTLVNMQPAFIVAISAVFLREIPTRKQLLGIAIAIGGALLIAAPAWSEAKETRNTVVLGDLLALSAAVTAAIYYSIGRHLRHRFGLWSYVGLAYTACAVTLLIATRATHVPMTPQPQREIAIFVALAVGPMLLGHTGMNWALKYMPAYVVNLVTLGEPVGATMLGALLPGIRQIPPALTLAGGAVVLTGVYIAARGTVSTDKTTA